MIFNSLTFLVFFAIVLAMHNMPFSWHQKKINLMIASYLFYAAWNPPFVILLWVSTVVDWWAAQWMVRAKRERTRKAWMLISVCVNLGMLGYFKYGGFLVQNFVTIAASLGVEAVYDAHGKLPGMLDAWVATLAFAGQIFCDFAGYSTSAIGVALCLGFAMPDNFRFPYGAVGFSDFWRRWHITLSSWLRDYLYIPLGGNKHGQARTYAALMGTMLLGGLWHGANWTFVVWGGLHGLYLSAERWLKARFKGFTPGRIAVLGLALLTFVLVNVTWVFFRAKTFAGAGVVLKGMAGMQAKPEPLIAAGPMIIAMIIVSAIFGTHLTMRNTTLEAVIERTPSVALAGIWTLLLFAVIIEQGQGSAFIYFAF